MRSDRFEDMERVEELRGASNLPVEVCRAVEVIDGGLDVGAVAVTMAHYVIRMYDLSLGGGEQR